MADRASMPVFVPRTIAAFERSATLMARRVTAPARSLAGRALAFADRVLGNWAAIGGEGERPAMRAAGRGGAMVVPRPWYEEPAVATTGEDEWPAARATTTAATMTSAATSAPTTTAATTSSATRGAAIARPNVTLPAAPADDARRETRAAELRAATAQAAADVRALVAARTAAVDAERTRTAETTARVTAERAQTEAMVERAAAERALEAQSQRATSERAAAQAVAQQTQKEVAQQAQREVAQQAQREVAQQAQRDVAQQAQRDVAQQAQEAARELAAAPTSATGGVATRAANAGATEAARVGGGDVRAAEALALHVAHPPLATATTTVPRISRTPLARALAHASWVDAQLHSAAPTELVTRATPGYVFTAPLDAPPPADASAASARDFAGAARQPFAPAATTSARAASFVPVAPATTSAPTSVTAGAAPIATSTMAASPLVAPYATTANVAAGGETWTPGAIAALPDLRLAASTGVAQRAFDFVARLVGVQAARDVALPAANATEAASPNLLAPGSARLRAPSATLIIAAAAPRDDAATTDYPVSRGTIATRAPLGSAASASAAALSATGTGARVAALPTPPTPPTISTTMTMSTTVAPMGAAPMAQSAVAASWRPGAAGARSEQLGANVDARIGAAWGEPATRTVPVPAATATTATTARPADYVMVAPEPARTVVEPATGPARLARFMDALVGVQAARATAQLSVAPMAAPLVTVTPAGTAADDGRATTTSAAQPASRATAARAATTANAAPKAVALALRDRAPARVNLASLVPASATAAMAPGGVGVRAEQLGGAVGVRAASLSIDFVDPARLAALTTSEARPATAAAAPATLDTIMPAPRPLLALRSPDVSSLTSLTSLSNEEWSLVATFPSAATAVQMVAARQASTWPTTATRGQSLTQTLLAIPEAARSAAAGVASSFAADSGVSRAQPMSHAAAAATRAQVTIADVATAARASLPMTATAEPRVSATALRGGAPAELVAPTSGPTRSVASLDATRLPGGRAPRGGFLWPTLADFATTTQDFTASAAITMAESGKDVAPGSPLWGGLRSLVSVAPSLAADFEGAPIATPATRGAPARGGAPPMSLLTAAARGAVDARASARAAAGASASPNAAAATSGAPRRDGRASDRPALTLANIAPDATRLTAATSLQSGTSVSSSSPSAPALTGPAARALELARPFLKLLEGSATSDEKRAPARAARFYEQEQPMVAAQAADPAASSIVAAMRAQPAATAGDDRVTLADLTLISMASATQQVAASPTGAGPTSSSASPAAGGSDGGHGGGDGHGGGTGNPVQQIDELAREAFHELQKLIMLERERSGD